MTTKAVNKIYVNPTDINQIADNYIEQKVKDIFSDIDNIFNLPKEFTSHTENRYHLFAEEKLYYDTKTGYLFPSIQAKSSSLNNKTFREKDEIQSLFTNFYFSQECKGKIIYVNSVNYKTGNQGTSWDSAFRDLQSALAIAKTNDQIWIAKGYFTGNFTITEGISIYGGFTGSETECWQRDSQANPTTFTGIAKNSSVFTIQDTKQPILICGVTITNPQGRGLEIKGVIVTLAECTIVNTKSINYGGAIYSRQSELIITDCLFDNNYDSGDGDRNILFSQNSPIYLLNSTLTNGRRQSMWVENTPITIIDCILPSNGKTGNHVYGGSISSISKDSELPSKIYAQTYTKEVAAKKIVKDLTSNFKIIQGFISEDLLELNNKHFDNNKDIKKLSKYLINKDNTAQFDLEKITKDIKSKKINLTSTKILLDKGKFLEQIQASESKIKLTKESIYDLLLNCETKRANITPYDHKMLTDINRGHWDLWNGDISNKIEIELDEKLIARDPKSSVNGDNIVAIDFGTKSTVVVYHNESNTTLPIQIGNGNTYDELNKDQYENPTVIEFKNLVSFKAAYDAQEGRPSTQWDDITVSHTAANNLLNNSSNDFYTVLVDLKQWAGDSKHKLLIKDKINSDKLIELPEFINLQEDDLNPIEFYAYHIGLFINNMRNGISKSYLLSFPVTYEKEIREKIRQSFYNGIKKALPETLINDEEFMKDFTVSAGSSEPAAYAVCALKEYGFEPEGEEEFFYAIFDFGGGTTDFDFGTWKDSKDALLYDYEIEHFKAKGDKYLGGENLLELLAFEIFKNNIAELRKENISFTLPPEQKKFPGCEAVLKTSQEAKMNMKQLIEKLRPYWENTQNSEYLENGRIEVNLFKNDGLSLQQFSLNIDKDSLDIILRDRIERGVVDFFESLRLAFEKPGLAKIGKINIFLAGNSCKSPIVKELFEKHIATITKEILRQDNPETELFELFPPLGELANEKLRERGIEVAENQDIESRLKKPTGKTGVAFGLIESREGGRVKVINRDFEDNDEVKFKYFLGINKRDKFKTIIDSEIYYNQWYEFSPAGKPVIELHFTPSANATTNKLAIGDTKKVSANIDSVDMNKNLYVRAVKSNLIQYTVASKDEIKNSKNEDYQIKELILEF